VTNETHPVEDSVQAIALFQLDKVGRGFPLKLIIAGANMDAWPEE
jgi:hypothetical protein